MPPKSAAKKGGSHNNTNNNGANSKKKKHADPKGLTDEDLDKLVAEIESKREVMGAPEGMTNAQIREIRQKHKESQRDAYIRQQMEHEAIIAERDRLAVYVNKVEKLPADKQAWFQTPTGTWVRLEQFDGSERSMNDCVGLFNKELTEPYVDFTYMHFILGWPDLCILAHAHPATADGQAPAASEQGEFVGAIVSSVARKNHTKPLTGYVAMLAVIPAFRKHKVASILVTETVGLMRRKGCAVVALETPSDMTPAVNLYTRLGFIKTKFLSRYYLQGQDAVRLKLFLTPAPAHPALIAQQQHLLQQQQQQQLQQRQQQPRRVY